MHRPVDLVIVFDAKASDKKSAQEASRDYESLLSKLKGSELRVAGKKGATQDQILVAVNCGDDLLQQLEKKENARDFRNGVSIATESTGSISPAERIRLVHQHVTTSTKDGGLGVTPGATEWPRVSSVFILHDHEYNDRLISSWKAELDISSHLDSIKDHLGEAVALYFAFLTFYSKCLVVPAILGLVTHFFTGSFDITYTILLLLWSITFVEAWRIKERALAVKWGVTNVNKVETHRTEYDPNDGIWWKRELKIVASIPIIGLFATGLSALITTIFIFEAFIADVYTGPGHQYIGLVPTVLFILTIPRFLSFYQYYAKRFTDWENHPTRSAYDRSLTLKTFALAGVVAYLNLALSAFVYVPFGTSIMQWVQSTLSRESQVQSTGITLGWWTLESNGAMGTHLIDSLRGAKLRNQVFAFTLTDQAINFAQEVILPFVLQGVDGVRKGKYGSAKWKSVRGQRTKTVGRENENDGTGKIGMSKGDWEIVDGMRNEVALEDYTLFDDYAEMVTQFGYIAIWSTCWPLAGLSVLANNWVELRSDAFKITRLVRRPIPSRTESIGAWLDTLSFITWIGALINAALIYLFNPHFGTLSSLSSASLNTTTFEEGQALPVSRNTIMVTMLLIALASSHAYIALRGVVKHVLEWVMWKGSQEQEVLERVKVKVREAWLEEHPAVASIGDGNKVEGASADELSSFWEDEGLVEIKNMAKTE